MKLAVLNDTHAGVRNSSDIFIEYQRRFYSEVFFPYCIKNDIKTILHLGDYYEHRKYINFKALNANRKHFLEPMREYGMTMDIIPGNHDVYYKSTNDLCALKELFGWFLSNVNIITEPKVMDYDGFKMAMIPWINNENYTDTIKFINECEASWVGAHLELTGFEMMRGIENTHGMSASVFNRFETVLTGHFHTKSTKGNITYLGSQMEFTWSDADDQKYFHVIDTDTRKITPVKNPITMFEKIIYNDKKTDYTKFKFAKVKNKFVKVVVDVKNDPYMFDIFIDKLQKTDIHELKIAETFDEFNSGNVDLEDGISVEDTACLLDGYVDAVDTMLNKTKLKQMLRNIYVEACNDEIV